jgi:hypothetical protein
VSRVAAATIDLELSRDTSVSDDNDPLDDRRPEPYRPACGS